MEKKNSHGMDATMAWKAVGAAFAKLSPRAQLTNPVMFLVYVSAILLTCLWVLSLAGTGDAPSGYTLAIVVMLWLTVLFSNYAEALAEGRGKAQADSLRKSKGDVTAHKVPSVERHGDLLFHFFRGGNVLDQTKTHVQGLRRPPHGPLRGGSRS